MQFPLHNCRSWNYIAGAFGAKTGCSGPEIAEAEREGVEGTDADRIVVEDSWSRPIVAMRRSQKFPAPFSVAPVDSVPGLSAARQKH